MVGDFDYRGRALLRYRRGANATRRDSLERVPTPASAVVAAAMSVAAENQSPEWVHTGNSVAESSAPDIDNDYVRRLVVLKKHVCRGCGRGRLHNAHIREIIVIICDWFCWDRLVIQVSISGRTRQHDTRDCLVCSTQCNIYGAPSSPPHSRK